ncbi:dolichyl-diphosphooligosaccharide--protein glycosyltransferase 48 kDa subunit [Phragmites australis]|uniref:dolichyl-diphosphooligosaccharide--protein glycosyltransferase 48 kDa subunit n=1 Tax=Phragmites australis TaxID=29695 RepID=UPI002D79EF57|nr:dolichyl-diphosphooligosaccharide--protein glycosyltransferase 48 kDa subunit [Phragmites australis]
MAAPRHLAALPLFLASVSLLALAAAGAEDEGPRGRRLLVLLDDLAVRSSHSAFFGSLQARGFDLDFRLADDPKLSLHRYGQYLYDGLVLFAPSTPRFGGSVDQNAVLEFIDAGHDMILAADSSASDLIRGIATECGVDFDEDPEAMVIDHINYAVTDVEGDHTLIAGDDLIQSDVILGSKKIEAPVLFRGIGHVANPSNSMVLKVLYASPSAYSANPKTKLASPPSLTGSAISLVSVMQARNNARVLVSGSLDLFSNRFLKSGVQKAGSKARHERAGNEQFVTETSKWVFHERGHLKAGNVKHHKVGETNEPGMYRINDDLEYSVEIYEWSGTSWKPYVADDVQVQFFMMSPYVLKTLSTDKKGLYSTSFKVPDVYGVFQFKVEYQRLGYTGLSFTKQIPVRPYRHNEYERFIASAYPYYTASFSTMGAFFIFSFVYLYHK